MGDVRDNVAGPAPRPSVDPLPPHASIHTSSSQIYATAPGKRAALTSERTAADRANAASSPYVGRRVANRPIDAPSGTLQTPHTTPLVVPAVARPVAPSPVLTLERPAPAASTARVRSATDTGTIRAVLAGLEPVDQSTSFSDDATAQLPLLTEVTPGKRRATRHTGRRGPLFRGLPSAPLLLGVAALAVSAGGAITANSAQLTASGPATTTAASALAGTSGVGTAGSDGTGTSRDSARGTLDSAAGGTATAPVEEKAAQRSGVLQNLAGQAEKYAAVIKENQWQTPLDSYRLTARFGQYGLWSSYHTGLDFAAPSGTPIHAIANGVVTSTGYDGSYGNKTVITLDDGTELWYCHQSAFATSVGDTVRGGELIGYVGSTGNTTGPHVHIEVRPGGGDPVDPYPAFIEHGVTP